MFRDRNQLSACCQSLLGRAGIGSLWTRQGPDAHALSVLEGSGQILNMEQRVILLACLAMWRGQGLLRLGALLDRLEGPLAAACKSLVFAVSHGPEAVDAWLRLFPPEDERPAAPAGTGGQPGA